MSIPTQNHESLTSNFPLGQCVGGGSISLHYSQFLTTDLTDTLEIVGSTCLTKYNVCLMPGWPLGWWTDLIKSKSCLLGDTAHPQFGGSAVFLMRSTHRCGTLIRPSPWLCSNLTRTASTDSSYSLTKLASASSCHLISISLAALVWTLAFLIRVSMIHFCIQAESEWRCSIVAFYIKMPCSQLKRHSIKICQIYVLHIFLLSQSTHILYSSSIVL